MNTIDDILARIVEQKKIIVAERKLRMDTDLIIAKITESFLCPPRPFIQSITARHENNQIAIIAELKKASPSKGLLCPNYFPETLALQYAQNGAACLSVLTDTDFFQGCDADLQTAKKHCDLPILRKDFIVDAYQIYESRHIGADCILLIAAILTPALLKEFYTLATDLNLDVLIEITNEKELTAALDTKATLIGINNRNLRNFSVDLNKTIQLSQQVPKDRIVVCESGIQTNADIATMRQHHIRTFLIGETLMKAKNPGLKLAELLSTE